MAAPSANTTTPTHGNQGCSDHVSLRARQICRNKADQHRPRGKPDRKQDELDEAPDQATRAAHDVAVGEFDHAVGEHRARQERDQRRHQQVGRAQRQSVLDAEEHQPGYQRRGDDRRRNAENRPVAVQHLDAPDHGAEQKRREQVRR
jgi:hypothetical protein